MNKGEVWIVNLPEWIGREQIGTRPALIMTNTIAGLIMIIPLTSNLKNLRHPYTLQINPSPENGLSKESAILMFHMRSMDTRRLIHRIGILEEHYIQKIDQSLKQLLKI